MPSWYVEKAIVAAGGAVLGVWPTKKSMAAEDEAKEQKDDQECEAGGLCGGGAGDRAR
jgi:hypothetical protein